MAIYLDWNATAPLRPEARSAWLAAQDEAWANPSAIHQDGQRARHVLDEAKRTLARLLGVKTHELICTSGGTEANALALHQAQGRICLSAIEHSSLLRAAGEAERIPVDSLGRLVVESVPADAGLVAFQLANNETGSRNDVPRLAAAIRARAPQALILLDACQGAGKTALNLGASGVDLATLAGHKFGAPKGCGLLYARNGLRLTPLLRGGRQQQDRRSGTEDPATVAALAAALTAATNELPTEEPRQRTLLASCFAQIRQALPACRWIAQEVERLANTLSLGHPGCSSEVLVQRLDLRGIAVSVGAACMAGRGEPSHVIAALGVEPTLARSVIRISIGHLTTESELEAFSHAYIAEVRAVIGHRAG